MLIIDVILCYYRNIICFKLYINSFIKFTYFVYFQSRPSLEQVIAIVDFMEKHPALGLGQMRGLEKRDECKKLWFKLTKIINSLGGPNRPMKSWVKVGNFLLSKFTLPLIKLNCSSSFLFISLKKTAIHA